MFGVRRLLLTYGCLFFSIFSCCRLSENRPDFGTLFAIFLFVTFASISYFETSLLSLPPISSAPIPSLLTSLFRFPIVRGRPHSLAPLFTIMRDNARLHAPSFSALSDHCHSLRAMKRTVHTPCFPVS
ncbi:hypothetical protein BDR05DRAFT_728726 [Suillus weaverae]|nr:hypothetical protein BDR05DRAFT_728726 [Suillus weaverae]